MKKLFAFLTLLVLTLAFAPNTRAGNKGSVAGPFNSWNTSTNSSDNEYDNCVKVIIDNWNSNNTFKIVVTDNQWKSHSGQDIAFGYWQTNNGDSGDMKLSSESNGLDVQFTIVVNGNDVGNFVVNRPTFVIHGNLTSSLWTDYSMTRNGHVWSVSNFEVTQDEGNFGIKEAFDGNQHKWFMLDGSDLSSGGTYNFSTSGSNPKLKKGKYDITFNELTKVLTVTPKETVTKNEPDFSAAGPYVVSTTSSVSGTTYYKPVGTSPFAAGTYTFTTATSEADAQFEINASNPTATITWNGNVPSQLKITNGWDFSKNILPKAIKLYAKHENVEIPLTYVGGSDYSWECDFTPSSSDGSHNNYFNFTIRAIDESNTQHEYYLDKGNHTVNGNWVENCRSTEDGKSFYQGGINTSTTYIFRLRAHDGNVENFDWSIVEKQVEVSNYYIHRVTKSGSNYSYDSKAGELAGTGDVVSLTFTLDGGKYFVISSKETTSSWDGLKDYRFSAGSDVNLSYEGNTYDLNSLTKNGDGAWKNNSDATHHIVVTLNKTTGGLTIVDRDATPAYNMPLKKSDFNGKVHYFLVGNRMGDFHLQPEWELQRQSDGSYAIKDRFMYPGLMGVAKVSNYDDYVNQRFEYYSCNADNNTKEHVIHRDFTQAHGLHKIGSGTMSGYKNYSKSMTKTFTNTNSIYFNDDQTALYQNDENIKNKNANNYGIFMDAITLTLDGSGNPKDLDFTYADYSNATTKAKVDGERIFTLIGSKIVNENLPSGKDTPLRDNDFQTYKGWQEAWIQYDKDGKPYYDNRGNFIYQTNYQQSWFDVHPSYFQDAAGWQFTSENLTFVKASELENLESDPYRHFYDARTTDKVIGNHLISGTGYNYSETLLGHSSNSITASDWTCYVLRDVYVDDEFKVWTGAGGGAIVTEGTTYGISQRDLQSSRWNKLNGGPAGSDKNAYVYDIDANGREVKVSRLTQAGGGINFKLPGRTYFKRVVLWYNSDFDQSVIQFIKETAAPEISAKVHGSNQIDYTWTIDKYIDNAETAIKSYSIKCYQVAAKSTTLMKTYNVTCPAGAKISDYINDVQKSITVLDQGVSDEGYDAGTYFYEMTMVYADGKEKTAVSNRVTIYNSDQNAYLPQIVPVQLLRLTADGKARVANDNDNVSGNVSGKYYLTYRTHDESNYYIIVEDETDGSFIVKDVNNDKAKDLINNHPEEYYWTAKYFVAVLDEDDFTATMEDHKANYLLTSYSEPTLTLAMNEAAANDPRLTVRKAKTGSETSYRGAVVDRNGWLNASKFTVTLDYTVDGTENRITKRSAEIVPVVPTPYGMDFKYLTVTGGLDANDGGQALRPTISRKIGSSVSGITGSDKEPEITIPSDINYNARSLNCEFNFKRPNVSPKILANYDILYKVRLTNDNENVTLDKTGIFKDPEMVYAAGDDPTMGEAKTYNFQIHGISPRDDVNPRIDILETRYVANSAATGVFANTELVSEHIQSLQGNAPLSTDTTVPTVSGVKLYGVPTTTENVWNWAIESINSFVDEGDYFGDKNVSSGNVIPTLYHVEAYDDDLNYGSAETLLTRSMFANAVIKGNFPGNASEAKTDNGLHVVFTPIYVFQRDPQMNVDSSILLEVESNGSQGIRRRVSGESEPEPEFEVVRGGFKDYNPAEDKTSELTGVSDITVDANTQAVYYNLNGVEVPAGSLLPGVYVEKRGNRISKIYVR